MNKNRGVEETSSLNPKGTNLSSSNEAKRRFNDLLVGAFLECVEFGEVIIRFIELNTPLNRDEIADKPELFAKELERLLGDGARIIEEKIISNLYEKIGRKYVAVKGYSFPDYVRDAQRIFLSSCRF